MVFNELANNDDVSGGRKGHADVRCCLQAWNLANMSKCLKCAGNDDIITMKVAVYTILHR